MTSRFRTTSPLTWLATLAAASHLTLAIATGTLRWEHVLANVLVLALAWTTPGARRLLGGVLPVWLAAAILDNQRYWLHLRGTVHTGDLWRWESSWFPATQGFDNWPAYFAVHTNTALDLICGFAYLTYLFWFAGFLLYFFLKKDPKFDRLAWSFLAINLLGLVGYMTYPAAPPWYIIDHGQGAADLLARGSAAGTARFDALFGISYFQGFYSRNPNPFGAMPSLHVGYTVLCTWAVWKWGGWWRWSTVGYSVLMVFSAVYLTHHYLLDAAGGIAVAVAASALVDAVFHWRARRSGAPVPAEGEPRVR